MKIKKLEGGGDPSSPSVQDAIPQYSSMEEYMAQSPYDRGGSGAIQNAFGPQDYLLGTFPLARVLAPAARAVGQALGLGAKTARAASSIPRKSLTYGELGPSLDPRRAAEPLQHYAQRAINEGARDESMNILDVQRRAMNVIDEMNLTGRMNNIGYKSFLRDIEDMFSVGRGGSQYKGTPKPGEFDGPGMTIDPGRYTLSPRNAHRLNKDGGKIPYKIIRK